MNQSSLDTTLQEIADVASTPNALRSLVILLLSVVVAYWLSHFVARLIVKVARLTAARSDTTTDVSKSIQLRRVETYLSVTIALVRAAIVGVVAFYVWQLVSPSATLSTAAIGAGAFFIVIAGATAGMILRDITSGSAMIIERWFNVGDFIRVEPFLDVNGVVERMTLRSTKLRNLNGEVVWLHNQHIQGVKVTEGGLRTLAVDVFAHDKADGQALIEKAISSMPVGPLTVANKLKITQTEQWAESLWVFTVTGQTPPGREWLIDDYFPGSLKSLDQEYKEMHKGVHVLARKPLVRYADPNAERSFRRAVRMHKESE